MKGRVIGGSGTLQDTVDVSATLGNCDGTVSGQAIIGQAQFDNIGLTGQVTLVGPKVNAGQLAATGGDARYLLLGGLSSWPPSTSAAGCTTGPTSRPSHSLG